MGRRVTERLPDGGMVTDDDDAVHQPFGGYTVETETLPDGRRIRYYAWRDESGAAGRADPGELPRAEDGPG